MDGNYFVFDKFKKPGTYMVEATPFCYDDAQGNAGETKTLHITVVRGESDSAAENTPVDSDGNDGVDESP